MAKRNHILVGILIIIVGIILLALMQRRVSSNYPWLHQVWPLIFIITMLIIFMVVRNVIISVASAMLALFAFVSYLADWNFLRLVLAFGCIGLGLLVLYHLVAEFILEQRTKQR